MPPVCERTIKFTQINYRSTNTFFQVLERAKNLGAGMVHLGLKPVNSTRVGIYSQNRVEVSAN